MGKRRQGFTLFEMIVTVAILAIGAAMVAPTLESFGGETRIRAGMDMVKGRLAEARARAVEESRPYRFEIMDATHCRVVADSGNGSAPGAASGETAGDSGEGTPGEDTLPKKVSFDLAGSHASSDNSAGGPDTSGVGLKIVFLPDGSALEDAEIRLTSPGARSVTLQLRALTVTLTTVRSVEDRRP